MPALRRGHILEDTVAGKAWRRAPASCVPPLSSLRGSMVRRVLAFTETMSSPWHSGGWPQAYARTPETVQRPGKDSWEPCPARGQ